MRQRFGNWIRRSSRHQLAGSTVQRHVRRETRMLRYECLEDRRLLAMATLALSGDASVHVVNHFTYLDDYDETHERDVQPGETS